jgi:hypothetical protein
VLWELISEVTRRNSQLTLAARLSAEKSVMEWRGRDGYDWDDDPCLFEIGETMRVIPLLLLGVSGFVTQADAQTKDKPQSKDAAEIRKLVPWAAGMKLGDLDKLATAQGFRSGIEDTDVPAADAENQRG